MKQFAKRLALLMVLVLSLTVFQGCAESDQKQEENNLTGNPQAEESESVDPSHAEQEPVPPIPPEEDEDLIREILLTYGATCEEPDESRMKTQIVSLYYADAWTAPEELPPGAYFSWFLTTVWAEELTDQELEEQYTLPDREGWAFPQEIYEALIQSRFDVSTDHLRSDKALYHPEEGVYWLGSGGGIGARPFVELLSVGREDDLLLLDIALEYEEEGMQEEAWQLTIQLVKDGGWKYRSWVRTDNAGKRSEEEAERLAVEEQARLETEVQAETERIAAEEAAAVELARQQMASAPQSTANERTDSSTLNTSTDVGSAGQTSAGDSNGQDPREEPASGEGKRQADNMGAVWDPDRGGWLYIDKTGKTRLIRPNGATRVLG